MKNDQEMKMVLAMITRSIQAIETAGKELAIQHRDLTKQADWIREEIRKISPEQTGLTQP